MIREYIVTCQLVVPCDNGMQGKDEVIHVFAYNASDALFQAKLSIRKSLTQYGLIWNPKKQRHEPRGTVHWPSWEVKPA